MHNQLGQFICSRMPDCDEAEDILQDVFVRIHTNLDTVRDMERVESWIYQIARNSIADYYRSRKKLVELTDLPIDDEPPEEDTATFLAPYIREVIASLPDPYRQALEMTEYRGISQKQLAGQLGISFSGAKSRVQRAREKVRDIMLACCHYEFDVRGMLAEQRGTCSCCCSDN